MDAQSIFYLLRLKRASANTGTHIFLARCMCVNKYPLVNLICVNKYSSVIFVVRSTIFQESGYLRLTFPQATNPQAQGKTLLVTN